jgi:hypothetical protein
MACALTKEMLYSSLTRNPFLNFVTKQVMHTVNSNAMSRFQEFHPVLKHISFTVAINVSKAILTLLLHK